ncbi:MAG: lipid A deacylase LpxR family protein [Proteobacteria bacterium]|nr:lipid A deacylase LpxR family protein [Pseudomonadota bacterium]
MRNRISGLRAAGLSAALALLSGLLPNPTRAASPECREALRAKQQAQRPNTWTLNFENDLFTGSDREYTNGVKLSWASANLDDYRNDPCLPALLKRFNHWLFFVDSGNYTGRNMVVSLGQDMFTPRDRARTTLDPNDRPYAGWLYFAFGYNARTADWMRTWELDLGMVGPQSYAEQSQNFIHRMRGIPRWQGWANQLPDEPGLRLTYERKRRFLATPKRPLPLFDIIPHYGATIGNVSTFLNAGAEFRVGYTLPDDFGTSAIRPGGNNSAPLSEQDMRAGYAAKGIHLFASLDARLVLHNIFLDGNTFRSSPSVDKRPFVGDIAWGVAWSWRRGKIAYAHYIRSKEFYGQSASQQFGSVTFSYVF